MYELKEKKKESIKQNNNDTGIPEQMKKRMEQDNRVSLDDIQVHYNSDKPKKLDALAYTKGSDIYLGAGQERHLLHELGHAVQQKMGMVHANTRHKNGEELNTDVRLEHQADQIGQGGSVSGKHSSNIQTVVQRMAVFEGMEEVEMTEQEAQEMGKTGKPVGAGGGRVKVEIPKVGRYKTEGWTALQSLRDYFVEGCISGVKVLEIVELNKKLEALRQQENFKVNFGMDASEIILESMKITVEFQEFLNQKGIENEQKEKIKTLCSILEQCRAFFEQKDEELEQVLLKDVEKKGEYVRVSDVDPYFNYKKMAIYCVAHMTTKIDAPHLKIDAGPHISITVFGERIYAANNTWNREFKGLTPIDMETLKSNIRRAIEEIKEEDIADIFQKKGDFFVTGAPFEARGKEPQKKIPDQKEIKEIHEWIQKIKGYPIVIVDIPEQREAEAEKTAKAKAERKMANHDSIHGEMTTMDYLQREMALPVEGSIIGFPKTTREILKDRNAKLDRVKGGKGGKRRVLQFGGTRIDCKKCHEHFEELRTEIEGIYVVSSQQTTSGYFSGTEGGTDPKSKGYERKAKVVASELKIDFDFILGELDKLKNKITENQDAQGKINEQAFTADEMKLIDDLKKYLPDIKHYMPVANADIIKKCQEIEQTIAYISSLWFG